MTELGGARARVRRRLPPAAVNWIRRRHLSAWPPVGSVRLGSLRRLRPISEHSGFDRGLPIDRYYIERFLAGPEARGANPDIHGRVLEIKEDLYASRFGDPSEVEVLDIDTENPKATI